MHRIYWPLGKIAGSVAGIALAVAFSGVAFANGGTSQSASETSHSVVSSTAVSLGRGPAISIAVNITNQNIVQIANTFNFSGASSRGHSRHHRHG